MGVVHPWSKGKTLSQSLRYLQQSKYMDLSNRLEVPREMKFIWYLQSYINDINVLGEGILVDLLTFSIYTT